ncbi:hypothetical protein LPTSP4_21140 [Leptospira ryugenii]|uniref:Uncharacterized protein n=1 Tax=Leptospira ryugenii TaxID=1917863 RepID=A0A2P2E122_9LEPT|nr:hypothetical protein [Leptospira ryugenii]GBF50588.1 hypothetical protein LPTSP4_21140 [Leptospira ryugenii]
MDANSGQASGGHTAVRIGETVYHFQYNFSDQILHIHRDPWSQFKFQYNVWENRNVFAFTYDLSSEESERYKLFWDKAYVKQERLIEIRDDLGRNVLFFEKLNKIQIGSPETWEVPGIGYWKSGLQLQNDNPRKEKALLGLEVLKEKEKDLFTISKLESYLLSENISESSILTKSALPRPPSLAEEWESLQQRISVREYFVYESELIESAYLKIQFDPLESFSSVERSKLAEKLSLIEKELDICLQNVSSCSALQETVLLTRMLGLQKSLSEGVLFVPKLGYYYTFSPEDIFDIPEDTKEEKKLEANELYLRAKSIYLNNHSEFIASEFEREIAKIDSVMRKSYDLIKLDPLPLLSNKRFLPNHEKKEWDTLKSKYNQNYLLLKNILPKVYSYHLVTRNCTGEIFTLQNKMFQSTEEENKILGAQIKNNLYSLSFIPFVAADTIKRTYKLKNIAFYPSFRKLKLEQMDKPWQTEWTEEMRFFSEIYKSNPYDQDFLFFTDNTILFRPIFGSANLAYSLMTSTIGIGYAPFDKGKRLERGVQSVLFSFPELFFLNIRKGYFPYVTKKDLPIQYTSEPNI